MQKRVKCQGWMEGGEDPVPWMLGEAGGGRWVTWDLGKVCDTAAWPGDTQMEHKPPNNPRKLGKTTLKATKKPLCQTWPVQWASVRFRTLSLLGWLKG